MSKPVLDFIKQPTASSSRVWLLLGAVLLVVAGTHYRTLSAELHDAQQEWDTHDRQKSRTAKKTATVQQNPTLQAAIKGMATNWDPLFIAVEAAVRPDVALLAMEPDTAKGTVRLNLEAKNKKAMQDYVLGLAAQKGLTHVSLLGEETQLENPLLPIRFSVGATWQQ